MTRQMKVVGVALVAASMFVTACATVASNVPVRGDPNTIRKLVGNWEGVYSSSATGRSGIITFALRAGTDTAQGEVIMIPRSDRDQMNVSDDVIRRRTAPAELLTIRFVAASDDRIVGRLDPYTDPVCGCMLTTRFVGKLNGDEIKGTFTSTGSEVFHNTTDGTWSVRRTPAVQAVVPAGSRP